MGDEAYKTPLPEMPETPQSPQTPALAGKSSSLPLVALSVVVALAVGGGVGYLVGSKSNSSSNQAQRSPEPVEGSDSTPTSTPTSNQGESANPTETSKEEPKESYTEDTGITNQKRFVSPRLGISFLFMSKVDTETINVKEVGNKVYVYADAGKFGSGDYTTGQYVEVFQKDADESLKDALKREFLKNYSESDCVVSTDTLSTGQQSDFPATYEGANIKVAGAFTDVENLFEQLKKCPSPYTQSNGMSYFLADSVHPDKFLFFSIGQYAIAATSAGDTYWQDTIQFLD